MKNMTIANICKACRGTFYGKKELFSSNTEIGGVQIDSRKITEGNLFIPMPGERADGHQFIESVMEQGALVTLSERELELDVPYILVDSCPQALKDLAYFYRDQLDCTIVGITGSVGKTSTKEMIAAVLEQKFVQRHPAGFGLDVAQLGFRHHPALQQHGLKTRIILRLYHVHLGFEQMPHAVPNARFRLTL